MTTLTSPGSADGRWSWQQSSFFTSFCCWFIGCTFLFPWNAVLTVEDYFYQVFPEYHPGRILLLIYMAGALFCTVIFMYFEARLSNRWRILSGFSISGLAVAMLIALDLGSYGRGGVGSFVGLCLIVVAFSVAEGTAGGAIVGELSFMTPSYLQALNAGFATAGTTTSVLRMATKKGFGDSRSGLRTGALTFLGLATMMELLGLFTYALIFPRLEIVKAFRLKAIIQGSLSVSEDLIAGGVDEEKIKDAGVIYEPVKRFTTKELFIKNWDYMVNMVAVYILTLSIFPGFVFENIGDNQTKSWYALVLIVLYNVNDLIGRYIPYFECFFVKSRLILSFLCMARFLLVPAFYFTSKQEVEGYMMFLIGFLGLSNGYLTVCIYMRTPEGYTSPEQSTLGNLLQVALTIGLTIGAMADWLWIIGKGW